MRTLLVANRGEIAVRIIRSAKLMGFRTVAVHSSDEATALHVQLADEAHALDQSGPKAYLDIERIIEIARQSQADFLHPGYGFLAENPEFSRACERAGVTFVGPSAEMLKLFGDKASARQHATALGVPVPRGTGVIDGGAEAGTFFDAISVEAGATGIMVKAVAGGGGRGSAPVRDRVELERTLRRCSREAEAAFGNGELFLEELLETYRHIEVQVLADQHGNVVALGDRDCSIQRRRQKLLEIAPAPELRDDVRQRLQEHAVTLLSDTPYVGLATVEFLVHEDRVVFLEVNPRIQVEHTVTEEIFNIDLVRLSLELAAGTSVVDLGLTTHAPPRPGFAIQARINGETVLTTGEIGPASGAISELNLPAGPRVRVDTHAREGMRVSGEFDSLLAKVIAGGSTFAEALERLRLAIEELTIDGVDHNGALHLLLIESLGDAAAVPTVSYFEQWFEENAIGQQLSVSEDLGPVDDSVLVAPVPGTIVGVQHQPGETVRAGSDVLVIESMKMEYSVQVHATAVLTSVHCSVGEQVTAGQVLGQIEPIADSSAGAVDLDHAAEERVRQDLQDVLARQEKALDRGRPEVVEARHAGGRMTAREHIASVIDPDSFVEMGSLALAAQRRRRSAEELVEKSPADGIITGTATIRGVKTAIAAYDYTVMAGTQGYINHQKTDRLLELAIKHELPLVLFAEGGGGRPGDTDIPEGVGLISRTFELAAELSGLTLTVAVVSGYCFAGNAALVGACDFVVATKGSNIGMGGPAMIEGGGLGRFKPTDIGPADEQAAIGVVDVLVDDDHQAGRAVRDIFGLVHSQPSFEVSPNPRLRTTVPESRLRAYDMRPLIEELVDPGSFLELGADFAPTMVTGICSVGGRPFGLLANNPLHMGGAIVVDGADKASRLLRICNTLGLPVLSLCDTPGFMVGPESDGQGAVRRFGSFFVAGAQLTVPLITVVTRKGYGLGAMAMAGGSFRRPDYLVAWPSGEFGGMGLEGAVRLGYKRELEAETDPVKRQALYDSLLGKLYDAGKALNVAGTFDIDDVIDPADTPVLISRFAADLGRAK
ncbi:carboxyl transferase domain-containing protein [Brevibacterium daeguense]|uniref:acetyl-CoA carboxylase n=1 Tax=Brevibacterium daeguense TaxID=909936 RepID=A0ABP8EFV3_9MICO|nr:carboxyl transferase domain-containing protein [Brevibacterium daeguense]